MSPNDTNRETMTLFSPQLAARLDALVQKYPLQAAPR